MKTAYSRRVSRGISYNRAMSMVPGPQPEPNKPRHDDAPGWLSLPQMRYPNEYVWFLFFSSMDVMLTWAILSQQGSEINPLAALVIKWWGLSGAIGFKFSLTMLVVLACEIVGRKRDRLGRNLARLIVVLSAVPVIYSLFLLALHTMRVVNS